MKFLFLSTELRPIHAHTLEERPMGGGTTSIIRLADALDHLGHDVYVTTSLQHLPSSKPHYIPLEALPQIGEVDVLIAVRGWSNIFFYPVPHKKCFYWTGDSMSNPNTLGMGDKRAIQKIDAFLSKSQWQAETICKVSGFPLEKTGRLSNGVVLSNFAGSETRHRKRLIYSSTPARGLKNLVHYFPLLKARHPELELHVFSSFDRLSQAWPPAENADGPYDSTMKALKAMPGCFVRSSILQKDLAREFMKSAILAYPTQYEETCCNTTLEAQAAGCAIVTSDLASLSETVGDAGILIKGIPNQLDYNEKFIEAVDRVLSDDHLFHQLSSKGLERAKHFDWMDRAQEFMNYLNNVHGLR